VSGTVNVKQATYASKNTSLSRDMDMLKKAGNVIKNTHTTYVHMMLCDRVNLTGKISVIK